MYLRRYLNLVKYFDNFISKKKKKKLYSVFLRNK